MINYKINAKGIEFIKATLSANHPAFKDEPATTDEALTYVDRIEKDANFSANGRAPEFCKNKFYFMLFSYETYCSNESEFFYMDFDMFDQEEFEQGDRG